MPLFIAAFLLVATPLIAFPNRDGEEEQSKIEDQKQRDKQQRARARQMMGSQTRTETFAPSEAEAAFQQASDYFL